MTNETTNQTTGSDIGAGRFGLCEAITAAKTIRIECKRFTNRRTLEYESIRIRISPNTIHEQWIVLPISRASGRDWKLRALRTFISAGCLPQNTEDIELLRFIVAKHVTYELHTGCLHSEVMRMADGKTAKQNVTCWTFTDNYHGGK